MLEESKMPTSEILAGSSDLTSWYPARCRGTKDYFHMYNGLVDDVDVHFSHFKVACVLLEKNSEHV
jgi:hypothetical protein